MQAQLLGIPREGHSRGWSFTFLTQAYALRSTKPRGVYTAPQKDINYSMEVDQQDIHGHQLPTPGLTLVEILRSEVTFEHHLKGLWVRFQAQPEVRSLSFTSESVKPSYLHTLRTKWLDSPFLKGRQGKGRDDRSQASPKPNRISTPHAES